MVGGALYKSDRVLTDSRNCDLLLGMDIVMTAKIRIHLGEEPQVLNSIGVVQPSSGGNKLKLNVCGQTKRAKATIMAEESAKRAVADVLHDGLVSGLRITTRLSRSAGSMRGP